MHIEISNTRPNPDTPIAMFTDEDIIVSNENSGIETARNHNFTRSVNTLELDYTYQVQCGTNNNGCLQRGEFGTIIIIYISSPQYK